MKKLFLIPLLTSCVMVTNAQEMVVSQITDVVKNTSVISTIKEYKTPAGIITASSQNILKEEMNYSLKVSTTSTGGTAILLRNTEPENTLGVQTNVVLESNVSVYPNPSRGIFTVQSSLRGTKQSLQIYNMLGENIYSSTLGQVQGDNEINISKQPAGMYFYMVTSGEQVIGKGKFIIQ